MLFTKTQGAQGRGEQGQSTGLKTEEKPLTCMIYFFASQMARNIQEVKDSRVTSSLGDKNSPVYAHRLDTLLSEVKYHARLSPFVTHFETFPVEMPPPGKPKNTSREEMHDTMLVVKFPHKRAWEQWVMTKEWQRFMEKTEREQVFRRTPHVRCASSLRGLHDPDEVFNT